MPIVYPMTIETSYDPVLVAASIIIAIFSSFVALGLVSRVALSGHSFHKRVWLTGGSICMGSGIWAMHFIGMLALTMPMQVHYDLPLTALSLINAIIVSAFALFIASGKTLSRSRLAFSGLLMGLGIASMHYVGMAAMRMAADVSYHIPLFALSLLIAVSGSMVALYLAFKFRNTAARSKFQLKALAAVVMGLTIAGMHYVGMAAVEMTPHTGVLHAANGFESTALVIGIFIISFLMQGGGVATILMDEAITSKKRSSHLERVVEESGRKFRKTFDKSVIGLFTARPDGQFIMVNKALCDMLGYTENELLQQSFQSISHPDDRSSGGSVVKRMVADGEGSITLQKRYLHKSGEPVWVEVSAAIEWGENGQPIQFIAQVQNINQRKKTEDSLRILSQAIEHAGEAVLITDLDGTIKYVNPAFTAMTGYTAEQAIGNNPKILKSSAQDPSFYKELWQTITRGDVWRGSLIDRRQDGSFYPALMSIAPIRNEAGKITHYVSLQQDMTEHQLLEEQFQQAQKMEAIGTLVGGIAHDFNNIISGVVSNAYLARTVVKDNEELDRYLKDIDKLAYRASDMISQLLTFARKDKIELRPIILTTFIKEAFKLARSGIPENIHTTLDFPPDDFYVRGDATQLQQVLMNLMNNARDALAGRSDPTIAVKLEALAAGDRLIEQHGFTCRTVAHLAVSDNGSGIPAAILDKVFQPFFTSKGVGKGTGLGLAMVAGAVATHHGIIDVESKEGKGTTIHIYLPIDESENRADEDEHATVQMGSGETVLLVDDEEDVRETTAEVLQHLGYKVLMAGDGEEAVNVFSANIDRIDIVVSDLVMPKLGGAEFVKQIISMKPDTPVIFFTGYDPEHATDSATSQLYPIINKPFSIEQISRAIRRALSR